MNQGININFSASELVAVIEALHDTTIHRLNWTTDPTREHWHALPWEVAQETINSFAQAYTKAMMVFRAEVEDTVIGALDFTPDIWEALAQVATHDNWPEGG